MHFSKKEISLVILVFLFLPSASAHAYLDPATGSIMFQMIAAAFVGSLFAIKLYWRKLKGWFTRLFGGGKKAEMSVSENEPPADVA